MASAQDSSTRWDPTPEDPTLELAAGLSETARALFGAGSTIRTLQRVVELGVESVDGCDLAGIFLVEAGSLTTPASTDSTVADIDALQHRSGEGPCLDVIAGEPVVYADDLADDPRWPRFAPQATAAGIRSVLALRLAANGTRGALNLYARYPRAFGALDRAKALVLASLAGVAITSAETRGDEAARAEHLAAALVTRELIGQAEGILIERERVSADQAFDILRRASQHLNVKLRDVAQDLVDTGEIPPTGHSPQFRQSP